jgi:DHA1 family bicyclomycin/chloramphenicol resistance-like MFS transporter
MVEMTLSVNLAAHCATALIVGNLGDKYGRKPILIISLIIFIIGSIFCSFAAEFWQLIFGRLLQGIGISGPMVLSFLVIADRYNLQDQQKLMGIMNGVVTLAMAFSPVIGSYISLYFHWRGNFIVLLLLSIVCLVLCIIYVPKGKANHNVSLSLKEYIPVLKSKKAMLYTFGIFCAMAQGYWTFIGISPILFMDGLGVSLKDFGFYQGAQAATFALGSLTSGLLFKYIGESISQIPEFFSSESLLNVLSTIKDFEFKSDLLLCVFLFSLHVFKKRKQFENTFFQNPIPCSPKTYNSDSVGK